MKKLKQYFGKWSASRLLRLALGVIFALAYIFEGQAFYLLFAIFLLVQAVMNVGCGCATSNCETASSETKTTNYDFEKLNVDNKDN